MGGFRIVLLAFADDLYILGDTAEMAASIFGQKWDTLRRDPIDFQPSKGVVSAAMFFGLGGLCMGDTPCRAWPR